VDNQTKERIKNMIARYKRKAVNYVDEVRKIDHEVMVSDLIELLEESAKV